MMTVEARVNGETVYSRSVRRVKDKGEVDGAVEALYRTDAGDQIFHDPDDGILKLSQKVLNTIEEV